MRILIVDDHAMLRTGLRKILEDELGNAEISEAKDAEEALRQLRAAESDVIVLDISMPGRSGLDVLPEIRTACPRAKVIVLSSFGDPQFAVRSLREGASAFLTKERAARELIDAIRTVVAGRRFVGADLAEHLAALVAADKPKSPHEALSGREFEVFRLIASAKSVTEVGDALGLSVKTVSTYRARILEKMAMTSNAELMQYAIRHGLVH
jgi:two-component system invasion response regulator UvrY